jgi:hypothetical protein
MTVDAPDRQSGEAVSRVLGILVIVYGSVDFLGPIVLRLLGPDGWAIAALWSGMLCGQAGFLAVWAGLGPFRSSVRWPLALLTVFGLYFSISLGIVASSEYVNVGSKRFASMASRSLVIPLLSLFALLPLWIRKTLGGWQIVLASEAHRHSAATARQFGLRHILTLTAVVGVALSLARVAMEGMPPAGGRSAQITAGMWLRLGTMCLVVCLYSAVWTLSSTGVCFLARNKATACMVMGGVWIGVSLLLTVVIGVMSAISGAGGSGLSPTGVASVFLHFAGLVAVLVPSLLLLRASGCVMIRIARKRQPVEKVQATSPFAAADQPVPRPSADAGPESRGADL